MRCLFFFIFYVFSTIWDLTFFSKWIRYHQKRNRKIWRLKESQHIACFLSDQLVISENICHAVMLASFEESRQKQRQEEMATNSQERKTAYTWSQKKYHLFNIGVSISWTGLINEETWSGILHLVKQLLNHSSPTNGRFLGTSGGVTVSKLD